MKKQIAYITDAHLDEKFIADNGIDARKNWECILEDVASKNIKEIVFGGDIGEYSVNKWFFESLKGFDLNISLGNHDTPSEATKYFNSGHEQGVNELYYAFEDGAFKHIFLDTSLHQISADQFGWLRTQLETEKRVLIFLHHPVLPVPTYLERYWPLKGRKEIRSLLEASDAHITLFCGHFHTVDEQHAGNITQIVTPAASYQTKKQPGSRDIPGFSGAYQTTDNGASWHPMAVEEEIEPTESILVLNNTTFGYRVITLNDRTLETELFLFKDDRFSKAEF